MLNFFFGFHGRIRRTHYFLGALATLLVGWAFNMHWLMGAHWLGWSHGGEWAWSYNPPWMMAPGFWLVGTVVGLACVWAQLALAAKRWHDAGASGWLALLSFIPFAHFIIFVLLCLLPPSRGDNPYGADPRTTGALVG